ncbi:hypothetical protein F5Y16DRAFT_403799 [Xylariaceae sp. FL0255]|nr:hypothetical protein F5Y16DRAFT_403799 [Xylariaceae sp. FL0255]
MYIDEVDKVFIGFSAVVGVVFAIRAWYDINKCKKKRQRRAETDPEQGQDGVTQGKPSSPSQGSCPKPPAPVYDPNACPPYAGFQGYPQCYHRPTDEERWYDYSRTDSCESYQYGTYPAQPEYARQ